MTSAAPTTTPSYNVVTHAGSLGPTGSHLSSLGTTSSSFSTSPAPLCDLTQNNFSNLELKILGWFLWLAIVVILVGNFACFYAVVKNIKAIMLHPFFQSNVFCVYLSFVDIFQVVLVGVPAAICYTMDDMSLREGDYNHVYVTLILDSIVWLQFLLVVAICVDRAGHIWRPFHYTTSIRAYKTLLGCSVCTLLPILLLVLPYVLIIQENMRNVQGDTTELSAKHTFLCLYARNFNTSTSPPSRIRDTQIFMTCHLQVSDTPRGRLFMKYEDVIHPLLMALAISALVTSSLMIIYKLTKSARLQKNNCQRQEEVARGIRLTCTVSCVQGLLILVSTLPLRVYQIDKRRHDSLSQGAPDNGYDLRSFECKYSEYYIVIARALVFVGPMFNPWLYPIRMASIRSFLATKKKNVVSSVNLSLMRLKSFYTQPTPNSNVNVLGQLVPESAGNTLHTTTNTDTIT